MKKQTLRQYLEHLGSLVVECRGDLNQDILGAAADSREVQPGWLFMAIPGQKTDGARFVPAALAAGATAVAAVNDLPLPETVAFIRVREAYPAAGRIAEVCEDWPARRLRLIGVTGTNGKTTSAYLLRQVFTTAGRRTGMVGTIEYDLGEGTLMEADRTTPTPFELQRLLAGMVEHGMQDAVLEVSSHALDQRRPGTARFAGALFCNLTGDHADYHQTMENYFAAKRCLFTEYLAPEAPAVINIDDPWGRRLARELEKQHAPVRLVTFGRADDADVRLMRNVSTMQGTLISLEEGRRQYAFASPLIGAFNAYNLTGVIALSHALGVAADAIRDAVVRFTGAPGRLQAVRGLDGLLAFVDYAHTDDALKNVLDTLRQLHPARLLVLFGCGGDRDRTKRPRMGKVVAERADRIYLTSDNPRTEQPEAILAEIRAGIPSSAAVVEISDRRAAIRQAVADARPGDILIVAGKGHETYQEQNGVKSPFNDVEELRAAMGLKAEA